VSSPIEGGRGLAVRLFGFPVHIDLSFVLVMGLIGWVGDARSPMRIAIWLVVAALAVLVHELGHAVVARTTGARPAIALTGFGGITTYAPPQPLSRVRSLAISVAGPGAGLAAAGVLVLVDRSVGAGLAWDSPARVALDYGIFTTLAWSVLNLVPVLPLDGGQAVRELLPGSPEVRTRRAAAVSIVAVRYQQPFLGMFLLFYGIANLQALRSPRADGPPPPTGQQAVVGLLWQGATGPARAALEAMPPGEVDLAVHGAVMAASGQREQGLALLAQEQARRPGDPDLAALVVLTHTLLHDWDAVVADLTGPMAGHVPLPVAERAIREATAAGRPDVAGRLAALPLQHPPA